MTPHANISYPHEGACEACRAARVCNYCGGPLGGVLDGRCTNGRCRTCHSAVCAPGGDVSPGHGFGNQGRPWRSRERAR